jgi:VWFA-related protein
MLSAAQPLSGRRHLLYGMKAKTKVESGERRVPWMAVMAVALFVACVAAAYAGPDQSAGAPPAQAPAAQLPAAPTPQAPPPQPKPATPAVPVQQKPKITRSVDEIIVPVLVRTDSGDPVFGLLKPDFRIFDEGLEQEIEYFANDAAPLSVVFLVDDDLPQHTADMVTRSLTAVLGGMAEVDEMAVVLFAQYPRTVADFGSDLDKLHTVLTRTEMDGHFPGMASDTMTLPPNPNGNMNPQDIGVPQWGKVLSPETKSLDDAVLYSAQMLHARPLERRKLLLIVSDGRNAKNNLASYDQVIRTVLASHISIYGIGVSQAVLDRKRAAIARYVDATGGDIFYAASRRALEEDYSRILAESRNRYTLAYVPRGTDKTKEYHTIEVRVERPNLKVTARQGYYILVDKQ